MKCNKCGSENLILVVSGPHEKLVCGDCLAFQKFLSAGNAKTFRQMQDPTRLSEVDELRAKILRKVVEAEEYLKNEDKEEDKEVDERAQFFFLVTTIDQIKDLCK